MAVRIVVDSTADLARSVENAFTQIPMTLRFGEKEYRQGVDLDHKTFYEMLETEKEPPTTSQASPETFQNCFREIAEAGDEAVVITISSGLSGTFQSAVIAAAEFPGVIYPVDSENVAIGAGILAEVALQLAKEGRSAAEIAAKLDQEKKRLVLIAMVDTLDYLKKGGRISAAVAFAGGLLNIKPIIGMVGPKLDVLEKARGTRQGTAVLNRMIRERGGVDFSMPYLLGYTGREDSRLQEYIRSSDDLWGEHEPENRTTIVGGVVGVHAGPGAVAVAFFHQ